ncbi:isoflavone reductase [Ilyonectria robusta]|uniref:isoflavone reductase n=1 Tax=Ilyonectria robusta TaxID=1079257 RepID=UPI001E8D8EDE|nr:isoflavone reductase [Ilyonectria robusta]KAH8736360.1 isoflavone reductase [Ilyonectria robusta]
MGSSFKNVLLIGASGNLGVHVLKLFLDSPYNVTILTRKESTSTFPEGVPVLRADYSDVNELKSAMEGQDVVISMVAVFATGGQQNLVDAAIAAGVKRFLPSEFGPPSRDEKFATLHPALPPKVAMVDYLRSKESQISWSALIPGAFFDWAMSIGLFGFDINSKTVTLIDGGTAVFTATTLPTIAKATLAMLEHADETKNQYVFISSFHISQNDILDVVNKLDGQKWTVKHTTSEELIAQGNKRIAEGDMWGATDLVGGGALGKQALGDSRPWGLWDEKLGLQKDDLEKAVREVLS